MALLLVLLEPVMKHRFQAEVEEVVVLLVWVLSLVLLWMLLVLLLHQVMLLWRLRQHLDLSLSSCLLVLGLASHPADVLLYSLVLLCLPLLPDGLLVIALYSCTLVTLSMKPILLIRFFLVSIGHLLVTDPLSCSCVRRFFVCRLLSLVLSLVLLL